MYSLNNHNKRVFIAIEFDNNIKNYLREIQNKIMNISEKGNFTSLDNFHLTLKFIGGTDSNTIDNIIKCIDYTASKHFKFNLSLDKLGEFVKKNKSIPWVGLKANNHLNQLYLNLEAELEKINIEKEDKAYTPHITLGRQIVFSDNFSKLKKEITIDNKIILVDKISLMESSRINGKLRYTPIYTKHFPL